MRAGNLQLDTHGRLKHFLAIEGLSRSLLIQILDNAERFALVGDLAVKKVPLLRGKTVANLFFEPSTAPARLSISRPSAYPPMC